MGYIGCCSRILFIWLKGMLLNHPACQYARMLHTNKITIKEYALLIGRLMLIMMIMVYLVLILLTYLYHHDIRIWDRILYFDLRITLSFWYGYILMNLILNYQNMKSEVYDLIQHHKN